jgi:hypothetical protein
MEAGPRGRIITHDLPRNDPYNGGPVVPADQCDEDYYSEASVQERKDRLSAKYGHLRAAAAERAEEDQRIADRAVDAFPREPGVAISVVVRRPASFRSPAMSQRGPPP